jgi:outer membrane protein TolC
VPLAKADTAKNDDVSEKLRAVLARPGGLTAKQAAARAADTSFDARAKASQVSSAKSRITQVLYRAAPQLTLSARYTRLSPLDPVSFGGGDGGSLVGTDAPPGLIPAGAPLIALPNTPVEFPIPENNYYLNANLTIPLSDYILATGASLDAAEANQRAAELNEGSARAVAAANAKIAYYNWVQRKLETIVAQQSLDQAKAQLDRVEVYFSAGRVAEADVAASRAFMASAELTAQRSQTQSRIAEQQLRLMMHEGSRQYEVGEDLLAPFPQAIEASELEALYREADAKRLEMRALDETARYLQRTQDVQTANSYPRLEAFGNLTFANPNQRVFPQEEVWRSTWDVGAQLVWSINEFGSTRASASQTQAQRDEILAQRATFADAVKSEVFAAYQNLNDARAALETTQRGVDSAESAHRSRRIMHENGRATNLELMETETQLLQARLEWINAHVRLRIGRVQLDHAVGRDVPTGN